MLARVALVRLAAVLALAVVLAGCGGSGTTTYEPGEVEQAFRSAGLQLQRVGSVGAEQPAMGEVSGCATRYLARSAGGPLSVSVCDGVGAATAVAASRSMRRANVAVEYAGSDPRIRDRIRRALDALGD